ncbi:MAG: hypothetical protein M1834_000038 [Cirrosporium novae-zelandiae]|nr:MAG: hypothetical protein M1834_000038 [Cirrosporium novae-zelandiae]
MADYSITIFNESNDDAIYYLFQEPPKADKADDQNIFTNIYGASPSIQSGDGSNVVFAIHKEWFAICGTPPAPLAQGVKVSSSARESVLLGQSDAQPPQLGTVEFIHANDNSPRFVDAKVSVTSALGGFGITTDDSFSYPNERHFFVGVGGRDPTNGTKVVPTVVVEAHPNTAYTFYPKSIYWICSGTFEAGEIVDIKTITQKVEVDFSKEFPDVAYTHNSFGDFVKQASRKSRMHRL